MRDHFLIARANDVNILALTPREAARFDVNWSKTLSGPRIGTFTHSVVSAAIRHADSLQEDVYIVTREPDPKKGKWRVLDKIERPVR